MSDAAPVATPSVKGESRKPDEELVDEATSCHIRNLCGQPQCIANGHNARLFDTSRALLHTMCRTDVYLEPPAGPTPAFSNAVWELRKVAYGLGKAMAESDYLFEDVACGRPGPPAEGLRMT